MSDWLLNYGKVMSYRYFKLCCFGRNYEAVREWCDLRCLPARSNYRIKNWPLAMSDWASNDWKIMSHNNFNVSFSKKPLIQLKVFSLNFLFLRSSADKG